MFSGLIIEGFEPHVLQKPGEFPDGCRGLFVLLKTRRTLQKCVGTEPIASPPDHQQMAPMHIVNNRFIIFQSSLLVLVKVMPNFSTTVFVVF